MEAKRPAKPRKARRRRRVQKRHFQASFLYAQGLEVTAPPPVSDKEREAYLNEMIAQVRLKSPPPPTDFRSRVSRIPEELALNARVVRQSISQPGLSSRKPTRPATAESTHSRLAPVRPQLLIAGLQAPICDKKESWSVTRPSSSQTHFQYDRTKKVSVDMPQSDRLPWKYFNAEIIPMKQQRTFTLNDIQKYLKYIGSKPFK